MGTRVTMATIRPGRGRDRRSSDAGPGRSLTAAGWSLDPDPAVARTAHADLRAWTTRHAPGPQHPSAEQTASIRALLAEAEDLLDTWTLRQLRFTLPT